MSTTLAAIGDLGRCCPYPLHLRLTTWKRGALLYLLGYLEAASATGTSLRPDQQVRRRTKVRAKERPGSFREIRWQSVWGLENYLPPTYGR